MKTVSMVMDDLGEYSKIIENLNLIVKLGKLINVCLRMIYHGYEGVILGRFS